MYTEAKRQVLFKDGLYTTYDDLSYREFVDALVSEPQNSLPVKEGYTLEGWYTDSALTQKWDFSTDRLPRADGNPNFILYAKWTPAPAAGDSSDSTEPTPPLGESSTDTGIQPPSNPSTGDNSYLPPAIALFLISGSLTATAGLARKLHVK